MKGKEKKHGEPKVTRKAVTRNAAFRVSTPCRCRVSVTRKRGLPRTMCPRWAHRPPRPFTRKADYPETVVADSAKFPDPEGDRPRALTRKARKHVQNRPSPLELSREIRITRKASDPGFARRRPIRGTLISGQSIPRGGAGPTGGVPAPTRAIHFSTLKTTMSHDIEAPSRGRCAPTQAASAPTRASPCPTRGCSEARQVRVLRNGVELALILL